MTSPHPPQLRPPLPPARPGSLGGVAFGIGIAAFAAYQQFKLPVVLPVLLERYGYERTLAGGFVSVYAVAGLCLSVWMGRLLERQGAARPVLVAMALIVVGSGLTLARPDSGALVLLGRGLEGIAFAALAVTGPVLANGNAAPRQLAMVVGLTATWMPVGQLTATAMVPVALATVGWTLLWWLGIAAALAIAALTLALQARRCAILSVAHAHGGGASARLPGEARLSLAVAAAIFTLWSGQYFAYMTWLPQYLVEVHGLQVGDAVLGYVVPVLFVAAFNLVGGALLRAGVTLGGLMVAALVTQSAVWWLLPLTGGGWGGVASLIVYGCGAGVVPTCLFATPGAVAGGGRGLASAFGLIMTGRNLGVLIGPVLLAQVAGSAGGWGRASPVFGFLTTLALALAVVLAWRLRTLPRP